MDILRIFISCIASIAVLQTAHAGCKEDTENSDEFKECMQTYSTYLANVGQSGDQSQILGVFCSPEGQAATSCMKPFIEKCDDLLTNNMLSMFGVIKQMGGCAIAVGGSGGMGGSGECSTAVQECMSISMGDVSGEPDMAEPPTEFNKFQEQIKTICGPVKKQFNCLKKYKEKCPDLEGQFKQMMELGRQQSTPGTPFPEFDDHKNFVMDECPKFPKDFTTSTCVKDNLNKKEFIDCYKNATKQSGEQMSCDAYKAAFPCVTTALKSCGDKYTSSFTATTNFYLAATFDDCKFVVKKESSGANVYTSSFSTLLIGLFLTLSTLVVL
ncbi:uncharacterized protein LOC128558444 [Mercenaria mercenaria]|uniref:uncharacterized protein LOC128558444 n=1 Tax=Mercenaria mercenaria TaxID=6596 RepID=UPI00234F848D|nr:uncharacterized protein LOC128558444 [Mercenaria mercenaria]